MFTLLGFHCRKSLNKFFYAGVKVAYSSHASSQKWIKELSSQLNSEVRKKQQNTDKIASITPKKWLNHYKRSVTIIQIHPFGILDSNPVETSLTAWYLNPQRAYRTLSILVGNF